MTYNPKPCENEQNGKKWEKQNNKNIANSVR